MHMLSNYINLTSFIAVTSSRWQLGCMVFVIPTWGDDISCLNLTSVTHWGWGLRPLFIDLANVSGRVNLWLRGWLLAALCRPDGQKLIRPTLPIDDCGGWYNHVLRMIFVVVRSIERSINDTSRERTTTVFIDVYLLPRDTLTRS